MTRPSLVRVKILRTLITAAILIGVFFFWKTISLNVSNSPSWETGVNRIQHGASDGKSAYESMELSIHKSASVAAEKLMDTLRPNSQSKKKVVMVTGSSGTNRMFGMPRIKEMVYENRKTYAEKHGFEFMWANMTTYDLSNGAPFYWNKISILEEAFKRHPDAEWVWWMDMDVIIMNMTFSICDHILSKEGLARNILLDHELNGAGGGVSTPASYKHDDINFIISENSGGVNLANFLMRRSDWSRWLLDLWTEPLYVFQNWIFPEQDAWKHMWQYHDSVRSHVAITNQHSMNAYPESNALEAHWQPGDNFVLFAGCVGDASCEEQWNKYWDLREKVEVPMTVRTKLDNGTAEIENVQAEVGLP